METVDVDTIFVTMKVTSDLYDCNHNCLTGVIPRADPSFQTAMRHDDLIPIKEEIRSTFGTARDGNKCGLSFSQIDYERDGCKGILVIVIYDPDVLKQRILDRFQSHFDPATIDDNTLRLQAIDELVSTVAKLMETANREYKKATCREISRC